MYLQNKSIIIFQSGLTRSCLDSKVRSETPALTKQDDMMPKVSQEKTALNRFLLNGLECSKILSPPCYLNLGKIITSFFTNFQQTSTPYKVQKQF